MGDLRGPKPKAVVNLVLEVGPQHEVEQGPKRDQAHGQQAAVPERQP